MYDSSNTHVEPLRRTKNISDNLVRTPDPQENKENPFATANEAYHKIPSTNKTPTEIIIPKFKLPSRSSELPRKHFSFPPNQSIPKKRSTSFDDISGKLHLPEPIEKLVSAKYHVRTISRSFDEYSSPSLIPTYEFAYTTAVWSEAVTDNLEPDSSVVTFNLGNQVLSKNIDSKIKIINESIDTRVNDTILDNSSKNLANDNDVDISQIKHTDAIKRQ